MAQLTINIGSAPNDGSGDPLRTAFDKCNQNFTDLYANGGGGGGGSGTVTSVSVVSANGVSASVSNPTTTPAMTFSLGAITPSSVNGVALSGSSTPSLAVTGASSISGSHSGTSSNTNTGDVSLASPNRYLSLTGQQITPALVDLASHVTGDLPLSNLVQASAENVLLGRGVGAGSGDFQQITIGSGLSMSGTTLTSTASGGAPTNAEYLVGAVNGTLTNERLVGNSASITANLATSGAATFERAALFGDVTAAANSNATTIAAGVVNTAKLGGDITTAGKALLDDVDAAAQRTTLGLGTLATQNGTFSGNSSGTNTGDVTLASPSRYLSLTGQQITPALVDLASHVTGDLPLSNLAQASAEQVLLGRGVGAGAGDFQQITLGTNLSMSGTTLNATGGAGGGNVSGPASPTTDNALTRWDGTSGQLIQNSGVTLSDTQEMAGLKSVAFNTAGGTTALATLTWDTTNQTLDLGIGAGTVNALLGVDSHVLGRNTTGSLITRGQVVRVNGASAGNLTIALAQGNTDPNTSNTIGIAAENIANNGTGMVITSGLLRNLNTNTFTAGDLLYISPTTAGLLVNTIPAAPNHAVRMGYVVSAHPSNGIIYVAVNNGYELNELHDVNYPATPATNDFLVYVTNRWENQTAATARTSMGLGTLATQNGTFSGTSSGTNTGDQTITLTGDVTGSGTGSFAATIQPNAVTTAKIANSNVTLAKIENTTGLSVLGNAGTVASAPANITGTAGQVLRVNNGGTALAFGAVDLSAAGAITGTLGVTNGGTGLNVIGAANRAILSNGTTTYWGQIDLTAAVQGTLPVGNGGTGATTLTGYVKGSGTTALTASSTIPVADVSGLGTGVATFLATPTSANLASAVTDETGSGALVFASSPALDGTPTSTTAAADTNTTQIATTAYVVGQASSTTPAALGTAAVGTSLKYARADHVHALPTISLTTGVSGQLPIANGGTGQATQTAGFNALSPATTKGDLILHDGTNGVRLAVGATNGHVLTVDSTTAEGVKWAAGGGGGGTSITNVWIPAAQWIPRTTSGCGIDSREQATGNINTDELLFDQATIEFAQAMVVMPSNYNNGTVTARFYWTASAGTASQGVVWAVRGRAFGDNVALGQTYATGGQNVIDTYFAANQMHVSDVTSASTIAGTPAANKAVIFEIFRDASNASDTLTADARLLGVEIGYTSA